MRLVQFLKRIAFFAGLFCLVCLLVTACGAGEAETDAPVPSDVTGTPTEGLLYAEKKDGTLSVVGYEGTDPDVTVGAHEGKTVSEIAMGAFSSNKTVRSVTLGAGVTKIGVAAFADCTELTAVHAEGSALLRVSNAAFLGCEKLARIALPATLEGIGVDAFLGCDALSEVAFDGDSLAWLRVEVGAHNETLRDVVTLAGGEAFEGALQAGTCSATVRWILDGDGVLTLTGKGHVPDYAYENAPWFPYAASVQAVIVEEGIDVVGKNAFAGCVNLTAVTLAESVRLIDDSAFYGCVALGEISLPNNLRRIGATAFYGCEHLRAVVIPHTVTHVGAAAFMNCVRLTDLTLSDGMTALSHWTFSGCGRLTAVSLPAGITEIGTGAFYGCEYLTDVTFLGTPTLIKKSAFGGCVRLTNASCADGWAGVTVMENNDPLTAIIGK